MSEQEMEAMKALDEAAEKAGGYLSPFFDSKNTLRLPEDPRLLP